MPPRIPLHERDWPTLPIPLFVVPDLLWDVARLEWASGKGLPAFQVLNQSAFEAALAQPYQVVFGEPLDPTVCSKAACLFRGLAKDHGLVDGNKRLAVTAVTTFLLWNGREPQFSNRAMLRYALRVAAFQGSYDLRLIEQWVRRNSQVFEPARLEQRRTTNLRFYGKGDPVERWFGRSADGREPET